MKRRLGKLVVFLLLGAIINVALAWGSSLWVDGMALATLARDVKGVTAAHHPRWSVSVASSGTSTLVQTGATRKPPGPPYFLGPNATKEEIDAFVSGVALPVKREVVPVPYWSRTSTPPIESDYEAPGVMEDARGWRNARADPSASRSAVTAHTDRFCCEQSVVRNMLVADAQCSA